MTAFKGLEPRVERAGDGRVAACPGTSISPAADTLLPAMSLTRSRRLNIVLGTIHRAGETPTFRAIVRLPSFERSAKDVLGSEEEAWLDNTLARRPELGAVIRGTGGVRKLRVALPGRGKRGGARVIYYYHGGADRVFLIYAYAKNRKDDLTGAEKSEMRKLTALLEAER